MQIRNNKIMTEYYENFFKLKKQMDNKVFVYDEKQHWENEIEECVNNNAFVQVINNFFFQKNITNKKKIW